MFCLFVWVFLKSKKGCSVFLFLVLTFSDISRVGFSYKRTFAEEIHCCRAQSYLNQRQLLEMRWTQRGTFPFTHRQVWHFHTCAGNKAKSRKNCLVWAASCHQLPCVRTPALVSSASPALPQAESSGLNPELTTAGVQSCAFNFFIFRSKTHFFQGILLSTTLSALVATAKSQTISEPGLST